MKFISALPLFIRINRKLQEMDQDLDRARRAAEMAEETAAEDTFYLDDSLGRSLHNIYCGIEAILEDIAEDIDGARPGGARYHADLLDQMTSDTPVRPAAIPDSDELRDLMRFRHLFRNLYGDPLRRHELLEKVQAVEEKIIPGMMSSLRSLQTSLEGEVEDPLRTPDSDRAPDAGPKGPGEG